MTREYSFTFPGKLNIVPIVRCFDKFEHLEIKKEDKDNVWKLSIFSDTATFSLSYAEYASLLSNCAQDALESPVVSKKVQIFPGIVNPETIVKYVYSLLGISTISLERTSKGNWRTQEFPSDQMVEFTFEQYQKILSGYFHDIVSLAKDGS